MPILIAIDHKTKLCQIDDKRKLYSNVHKKTQMFFFSISVLIFIILDFLFKDSMSVYNKKVCIEEPRWISNVSWRSTNFNLIQCLRPFEYRLHANNELKAKEETAHSK